MGKVIDSSIPAVFSIAVIFFFFSQIKKARNGMGIGGDEEALETSSAISELYNDLYSSTNGKSRRRGVPMNPFEAARAPPLPKNVGIPKREYLKISNMNERFDAYDYSLAKAVDSKAKAAATFRSKAFDRALGLALNAEPSIEGSTVTEFLAPRVKNKLIQIEKKYLKEAKSKFEALQKVESTLAAVTMDDELAKLGEKAQQMNSTVIDVAVES